MTREEWNELAAAMARMWQGSGTNATSLRIDTVEQVARTAAAHQVAAEIRSADNVRPVAAQGTRSRTSNNESDGSVAGDVLKTIGLVTGVGPLVTGLMKLFGGSSDRSVAEVQPVRYEAPPSLRLEAGLLPSRAVSHISYAQNALVRADAVSADGASLRPASTASASVPAIPQIHIQVNAMDSRSFMDHSDDIAHAVRAAMLRSHALNDVVSEV